jgi:hypothetical protein
LSFEKSIRYIISFHLPVVYNSSKTVGKIAGGFSALQRAPEGRQEHFNRSFPVYSLPPRQS